MQSSSQQPLVGEEHCVTNLVTAAKETTTILESIPLLDSSPHPGEHSPLVQPVRRFFNVPQYINDTVRVVRRNLRFKVPMREDL